MFTHPRIASQFRHEHQSQMLAAASRRQLHRLATVIAQPSL